MIDRPRRELWRAATDEEQIFLVEQHSKVISSGPGLIISSLIPETDCFNGRGGRALPLYHPDHTPTPDPTLLGYLTQQFGTEVTGLDLLCYVAGVASHPGFTERFESQLETPGIRVPLTADPDLFARAVEGR